MGDGVVQASKYIKLLRISFTITNQSTINNQYYGSPIPVNNKNKQFKQFIYIHTQVCTPHTQVSITGKVTARIALSMRLHIH